MLMLPVPHWNMKIKKNMEPWSDATLICPIPQVLKANMDLIWEELLKKPNKKALPPLTKKHFK